MIKIEIWLPQILGYCEFIADAGVTRKAWVDGDLSDTSLSNYDELYEQIFDDLDSENYQKVLDTYDLPPAWVKSLKDFLSYLQFVVDKEVEKDEKLCDPSNLISSPLWAELREKAVAVLANDGILEFGIGNKEN